MATIRKTVIYFIQNTYALILGTLFVAFTTFLMTITLPVYLCRYIVSLLAKHYRPDLSHMLKNQSALLAGDFLSKNPQRANNILTLVIKGNVSIEEIKQRILQNWITNPEEPSYQQFTQYPVLWLGFKFWKTCQATFDINNHVTLLSPKDAIFTQEDLDNKLNKLLNTSFSPGQSPWKIFLVENYQLENSSVENEHHCVLMFKWHHCLGDGYAVCLAMLPILLPGFTPDQLELPNIQFPTRKAWQKFLFLATFFPRTFYEAIYNLSNNFLYCPLKVPDSKKRWHQVTVRAKPISIQDIKNVKNFMGVSFTSVLLSAVSAAVDKFVNKVDIDSDNYVNSIMFTSVLPIPGPTRTTELTNYATGAVFWVPIGPFDSSLKRLQSMHEMLYSSRNSVGPYALYNQSCLLGNNFHFISSLFPNKTVGIGLTNFAGVPSRMTDDGRFCKQVYTVAGGLEGDLGVCITAVSHERYMYLQAAIESALMNRKEAQQFVNLIVEEIKQLACLIKHDGQNNEKNGNKME